MSIALLYLLTKLSRCVSFIIKRSSVYLFAMQRCTFTSDLVAFCNCLATLKVTKETLPKTFDVSSLLSLAGDIVSLPDNSDPSVPPPYVVRLILLYGRSHCHPSFDAKQSSLFSSPYFFFDVLYIHQPPEQAPQCEKILDALFRIDSRDASYCLETSNNSNAVKLFNAMSLLLGHPLQRPLQMEQSTDTGTI
eukprot:m.54519 g.54519  ORF g.54519 m.54519 type:complete len:192 (+) comp34376_c0_seq7:527-1102(+)